MRRAAVNHPGRKHIYLAAWRATLHRKSNGGQKSSRVTRNRDSSGNTQDLIVEGPLVMDVKITPPGPGTAATPSNPWPDLRMES